MKLAVYTIFFVLFNLILAGCANTRKCSADFECNEGRICNLSVGKCEPLSCSGDNSCPVGFTCKSNNCVAESLADAAVFDLSTDLVTLDVAYEGNDSADTSEQDAPLSVDITADGD